MTTNHSLRPRGLPRALRLLTLACFVNFSGVHNGYSALLTCSPLNINQSVSLTAGAVRSFHCILTPKTILVSANNARAWFSGFAAQMERVTRSAFSWSPIVLNSKNAGKILNIGRPAPSLIEQAQLISWKKEIYVKKKKESWRKIVSNFNGLAQNTLQVFLKMIVSEKPIIHETDQADETRIAYLRKMFCQRADSGSGDFLNAVLVARQTITSYHPSSIELGFFVARPI